MEDVCKNIYGKFEDYNNRRSGIETVKDCYALCEENIYRKLYVF